ncbi:anaerobic ribonucleoside-triphosphate reductase activating protein [Salisediminibacterium halotolerans]|uniref:anaerobic ribonucleoside-triphosphate reductase activating protein n=1 Tax=Salisediminibacterium halotolerans TaxID=517425 RepID=UPI000EAE3B1E|nr:anaerobic ribonucleoside-triphosphate reductase activating protein [Salisediminibacterium halotolerans]RLJ73218.1 ribonucleoside-triphosphate reductase class III activase subunit [Actinophytocola xinjiangensis]RPE86640.1 ribonucleoside-triphosphate reductase class III activase subunit [Salisediminibacterium halotolerans]TWG34015.1 ribonucleoside-triphosphate reductase class III activase subunit [Salisediminibacterium halotolerans]GEL09005.1 anaerobic ribonucleoside-triphosphate reductase-act
MKVLAINRDSIVDGEGLRTVVYFAGCPHRCYGCHNPESWDYDQGEDYTADELVEAVLQGETQNVTLSGGEPFAQAEEVYPAAAALKRFGLNVWSYTGYEYEELAESGTDSQKALLETIDVLVDGPYRDKERDTTLAFRGSRNQRIIRLKEQEAAQLPSK